jgi:hypothetical protein
MITKVKAAPLLALAIALSAIGSARAADDWSILTYQDAPDRSGNFVVPALTVERARDTANCECFYSAMIWRGSALRSCPGPSSGRNGGACGPEWPLAVAKSV